jgi:CRP-like cAMP-binding protein
MNIVPPLTPRFDASAPVGSGVANGSVNARCSNTLFDSFPWSLHEQLRPFCDRIALKPGDLLFNEQTRLAHLFFPEVGAIALMGSLSNGNTVQVGFVDRHGVAGLPPLQSPQLAPYQAIVLLPGTACRMRLEALPFALRDDAVRQAFERYLYAQLADAWRLIVCNAFHLVDQRLARWLLVLSDIGGDDFAITHDTLATMLGVRRPSITLAALSLQEHRAIEYQHGRMRVRDRDALEEAACECNFTQRGLPPRQTTEHL